MSDQSQTENNEEPEVVADPDTGVESPVQDDSEDEAAEPDAE